MVIAMDRNDRFFRALSFRMAVLSVVALPLFAVAQNSIGRPVKFATEYDWSMSPAEEMGQPGSKTVNLPACPPGVKGNEPEYWILIHGSEPARVTGRTCAGDGRPGTLQRNLCRLRPKLI